MSKKEAETRRKFNAYLRTEFTTEEVTEIYTYLGNDIRRDLCEKFVLSGYDMNVITDYVKERDAARKEDPYINYKFEYVSQEDDIYDLDTFIEYCEDSGFVDDDGVGWYVKDNKVYRIPVSPYDIVQGNINRDFTHVSWHNK